MKAFRLSPVEERRGINPPIAYSIHAYDAEGKPSLLEFLLLKTIVSP